MSKAVDKLKKTIPPHWNPVNFLKCVTEIIERRDEFGWLPDMTDQKAERIKRLNQRLIAEITANNN